MLQLDSHKMQLSVPSSTIIIFQITSKNQLLCTHSLTGSKQKAFQFLKLVIITGASRTVSQNLE